MRGKFLWAALLAMFKDAWKTWWLEHEEENIDCCRWVDPLVSWGLDGLIAGVIFDSCVFSLGALRTHKWNFKIYKSGMS